MSFKRHIISIGCARDYSGSHFWSGVHALEAVIIFENISIQQHDTGKKQLNDLENDKRNAVFKFDGLFRLLSW